MIYRLTLHPLAAFPGPWYACTTEWYNIWSCIGGERHLEFKRWHDRYGEQSMINQLTYLLMKC